MRSSPEESVGPCDGTCLDADRIAKFYNEEGITSGESSRRSLPSCLRDSMNTPYFDSPEVARLQVLLDEVTRAKPGAPETRFVQPEGGLMDRLESRFHHVLYGRRGTGKSSLLRRTEAAFRQNGSLVAWVDQETYVGLSYPDVLVSTLADTFAQFALQLRATAPQRPPRRFWQREQPGQGEYEKLASNLEVLVAQLLDLKRQPSESQIEWTASSSAQLAATLTSDASLELAAGHAPGHAKGRIGRSRSSTETNASTAGITQKFAASKAEHLEKALTTYRAAMQAVTKVTPDAFIILDDFYRLLPADQPRIAGYFHRVVKDTSVWLKLGTIRYWTQLYSGGSHSVGLQAPHDIKELSLDRGLLDFKKSKKFLEEILGALAAETEVEVELLFTAGALDRLVLAGGGVPRDYISLVSESIAVAKGRGVSAKAGTERVIAEDVNEAAGRTVETKFNDLAEDAGAEASELRELVVALTNHCRETRSACFLVDFRESDLVTRLNRLQTMRFVHAIDDNETLPDPQSSRYNVYVLDVSQLAAQRAWQVDFTGWTKREKRRARKLVFTSNAAMAAASAPVHDEPFEQLAIDDELAIVGSIDAPGGSPAPDGSIEIRT